MSNQANRGRRRKRKNKLLPAIIAVLIVVALAVGLYIYVSPAMGQNTIYPNVIVAGVNVGGMSKMQAEEAVREAVEGISPVCRQAHTPSQHRTQHQYPRKGYSTRYCKTHTDHHRLHAPVRIIDGCVLKQYAKAKGNDGCDNVRKQ